MQYTTSNVQSSPPGFHALRCQHPDIQRSDVSRSVAR